MQRITQFKEMKLSSTKIIVGSNHQDNEVVFEAFEQWRPDSSVIVDSKSTEVNINNSSLGLLNIKENAVKRMQACALAMGKITEQDYVIAVGIENGMVLGAELKGSYLPDHWYDIGFVAVRIYQQGCPFEYVATMDLSNSSREEALKESCFQEFQHLGNIHMLDYVQQKFDRVILFGTFDLFHDLHRKLLDDAKQIANEIIVYVNEDKSKFKRDPVTHKVIADTKNAMINSPEERRRCVAEYLGLNGIAILKTGKHVDQLQSAIYKSHQLGKTVAVFGGCDQFENYPQILNVCYTNMTPIITRSRGETDTLFCTTDLKTQMEYRAIAAKLDIDLAPINSGFFKKHNKKEVVEYLKKPSKKPIDLDNKIIGLTGAEVWKYQREDKSAVRITKPYQESEHILLCLPGRTRCDVARARKILATIHCDLVPSNLKESVACFIGCYSQEEKNTADDLKCLKSDPNYFSEDAKIFTELLIWPRIKNKCMGITLWARSYGTVMAIEIENALQYLLQQAGYSEHEIVAIAKEIRVLSISNLAPLERTRLFTTVSVTGYNDAQAEKYIENFPEMVKKYYRHDEAISKNVLSPTHEVVMVDVPERFTELSTGRLIKDPKRHYTPNYDSLRKPDTKQNLVNNACPDFIHSQLETMLKRDQLTCLEEKNIRRRLG